ncbi:hypothetical protein ZWY2020_058449 [Hordeum vulgare]|nr:hypothetical protein ZWY2020_058449 [Hordeum vulgare]
MGEEAMGRRLPGAPRPPLPRKWRPKVPVASCRSQARPAPAGAAWGLLAGDGRVGDGPATARRAGPPLTEVPPRWFSDGTDAGYDRSSTDSAAFTDYMASFQAAGARSVGELVDALAARGRPVTRVVYTMLLPWAADVAREKCLPSALYWIQPAAVLAVYYHYFHGYAAVVADHRNDPSFVVRFPVLPQQEKIATEVFPGAPCACWGGVGAGKATATAAVFLGSAVPPIGTPCGGANARRSRYLHTRPPPSQSVSNTSRFGWTVRVLVQLKSRLLLAVIRREGPWPESPSAPILDEASHVANKFAAGRSVGFVGERSADFAGGRRSSAEHSNVACYGYTRGMKLWMKSMLKQT